MVLTDERSNNLDLLPGIDTKIDTVIEYNTILTSIVSGTDWGSISTPPFSIENNTVVQYDLARGSTIIDLGTIT